MQPSSIPPDIAAWFDGYTNAFMVAGPQAAAVLAPRIEHSRRVAAGAEELARTLGMGDNEALIAGIAGLLHDVGRCSEYAHTGELAIGAASHAALGYEAVRSSGILESLPARSREIVLAGILHHNTSTFPASVSQEARRHILILRDADKLDKYHMVCDLAPLPADVAGHPAILSIGMHGPLNPKVIDRIRRLKKVKGSQIGSTLDFYLMVLSLVFVLTHAETFRHVSEHRYLGRIAEVLPDDPGIAEAVETILAFFREKIGG